MHPPHICLIVPVYNEQKRLMPDVYDSFMIDHADVHLLFVNDASTDGTEEILIRIQRQWPSRVKRMHHNVRMGKAEAIRTGMLYAVSDHRYKYLGFIDADLAVPLADIVHFAEKLSGSRNMMAFGIRESDNQNVINRTPLRKLMGSLFKQYLHIILRFYIADSQCGAKIFNREIVDVLYRNPFKTHWLMDVELMIRFCDHFHIRREEIYGNILQIPVSKFEDKADSKVNLFELMRVMRDLATITFYPGVVQ